MSRRRHECRALELFREAAQSMGYGDSRNDIHRGRASCLRVCKSEPMMVVYPEGVVIPFDDGGETRVDL